MGDPQLERPRGESPDAAVVDRRHADDPLQPDHSAHAEVRTRGRRVWWLRAAIGVVAVFVLYYLVTLAQVLHTGGSHGSEPVDAIFVMGAAQYDGRPSPQLAARLDHAVTLWDEGVAPLVVVTGGNIPGDRFTEAEASARYLIERGVPVSAIVEVGEGSSTHESVEAAGAAMSAADIGSVAVVTDPYHALRSRLILEDAGVEVDVASTPSSVVTGWGSFRRSVEEAAGVALGRIIGFDRLSNLT